MSYKSTNQSRSQRGKYFLGFHPSVEVLPLVTMTASSNALPFSWEFGTAILSNFPFVPFALHLKPNRRGDNMSQCGT